MDSAEEKKWFIYVGDHHEGPFSLNDLRGKVAGGIISATSYTWADGMADWQLMTEVQALAPLFSGKGVTPEQASALAMEVPALATDGAIETIAPPVADAMAQPMSVSLAESVSEPSSPRSSFTAASERSGLSGRAERTGSALAMSSNMVSSVALESNPLVPRSGVDHPGLKGPSSSASSRSPRGLSLLDKLNGIAKKIVILLVITGLGWAYSQGHFDPALKSPMIRHVTSKAWEKALPQLLKLTEKAPFLAKWISPIPALPDVSPEDYEELKQAALARPASQGVKFGVAMSKDAAMTPVFYVTGNLSDGTRLKLVLSGVSETLLDTTFFNQVIPVSINKKFSKTDPLKPADGKLPRGQYLVTLVEATDNPQNLKDEVAKLVPPPGPNEKPGTLRALSAKSYFMGGVKDTAYAIQLKAFHETLTKKASEELLDAKAYADLFDKQLTESIQRFEVLHKAKKLPPAKKKMWADFHAKWSKLFAQAEQGFAKSTPEQIKAERFYSGLYLMLSQVALSVDKVHRFQDTFVTGSGDKKALDIQIGEAQSTASAGVSTLKSRLEAIEKAAGPAGSLPLREDQIP